MVPQWIGEPVNAEIDGQSSGAAIYDHPAR